MLGSMFFLAAVPDAWIIGFSIFNIIFNALLSIAIWKLTQTTRRYDTLEADLKVKAEQQVKLQFEMHRGTLQASMDGMARDISQINQRLDDGDEHLDGLKSGDHKLEIKTQQIFSDLRLWVAEHSATKGDLQALSSKVEKLQQSLTVGWVERIEHATAALERAAKVTEAKK